MRSPNISHPLKLIVLVNDTTCNHKQDIMSATALAQPYASCINTQFLPCKYKSGPAVVLLKIIACAITRPNVFEQKQPHGI